MRHRSVFVEPEIVDPLPGPARGLVDPALAHREALEAKGGAPSGRGQCAHGDALGARELSLARRITPGREGDLGLHDDGVDPEDAARPERPRAGLLDAEVAIDAASARRVVLEQLEHRGASWPLVHDEVLDAGVP